MYIVWMHILVTTKSYVHTRTHYFQIPVVKRRKSLCYAYQKYSVTHTHARTNMRNAYHFKLNGMNFTTSVHIKTSLVFQNNDGLDDDVGYIAVRHFRWNIHMYMCFITKEWWNVMWARIAFEYLMFLTDVCGKLVLVRVRSRDGVYSISSPA